MSSASSSDALAKAIYPYLTAAGFYNRALSEAGWFDFVDEHRPETQSAVTMACHAFTFLFVDGKLAHMRLTGVQAILAYLSDKKGHLPPVPVLKQLKALCDAEPINNEHVHEWFHRNYP